MSHCTPTPDPELHTSVVVVLLPRTGSTDARSIVVASSMQARVPRGHADFCTIILISPCLVVREERCLLVARCSSALARCGVLIVCLKGCKGS
jgi:hypothetical protein